MKIDEIHIYGYGKFENVKISNLGEFQVFYGENEAGKSTIMSFIHSILFGFPTKQQSERRYEPKRSAKYGGQLTVILNDGKKAIIERVKGKATGDVSVLLDDGTRGGEELLKKMLLHIDKSLFQSIFSFNLHGLQNVHQLKSEDLGKFLFSAGTLGSDRLLTVENDLQKELDSRFKPSGKKPFINEKLKELRQLHGELKRAEQQNDQYWNLLQQKSNYEKKIALLENEAELLKKKLGFLDEWKRMLPLIKEQALLREELKQYHNIAFPINGLKRLDWLEQNIQPLDSRIKSLEERIQLLEKEIADFIPQERLIECETEILAAVENIPLYEQLKAEENQIKIRLEKANEEISILKEELHAPVDEEWLKNINTSVFMKEKAADLHVKNQRLKEKQHELDLRFSEEKDALKKIEETMKKVQSELLPENDRLALKEKLGIAGDKRFYEKELQDIKERIAFYNRSLQKEKKQKEQALMQQLFFSVLLLVAIGWGIYSKQWIVAAAAGTCLLFQILMIVKVWKSNTVTEILTEIQALKDKEKDVLSSIKLWEENDLSLIKDKLDKDEQLQEQHRILQIKWQQQNEQFEKIIAAFESWEQEARELERQTSELRKELQLPGYIDSQNIYEAFQLIEQLKVNFREKLYLKERLTSVENGLKEIEKKIFHFADTFLEKNQLSIQESAFRLKNLLKLELGKQIQYNEKQAKIEELKDELYKLSVERKHFQKEAGKLLSLANAKTAEQFREIGKRAEMRDSILERLEEIERQMRFMSVPSEQRIEFSNTDPDELIEEISKKLEQIHSELQSLREQLAEVKYEISVLENGGTYSELLHKYSLLKSEFEEDAKEWARFAVAKDLLAKTIERYKKKHLPRMIAKAEEFLSYLTEGNYIRIHPQELGSGFLIENKEHILFEANELSQATAEQVYVSLRLALAVTLYKNFHFPIMIDDGFVNFDENRTKKVITLLKRFTGQQILLFTCHKHLLHYFDNEQIKQLGREKKVPIW
ncbi:hypothetical protein PB1_03475 [Bacillus methanolicus PB1]|uniref:YhaN AAA domain-containing protein n=1 Tax=Bacillus methanolicus PB1 TaxID=997296 RepID=I3E647_BACMT|nr:AAA family ATPase [Bacillus methanolicus]EIJ81968.1 hypothetical protein PB1_03475 [Bacillus methanolicus PB1]